VHCTERFSGARISERLELVARIDDPKGLAKPWTTTTQKMFLQLKRDLNSSATTTKGHSAHGGGH